MENYELFVDILNNELKPAMGCTEPIAIALCASKVKDVLGCIPTDLEIYVSGNIIKNVTLSDENIVELEVKSLCEMS